MNIPSDVKDPILNPPQEMDVTKAVDDALSEKRVPIPDQFDKIKANKIHQGHGSKLDSDLLDGYEASQFIQRLSTTSQSLFNDGTLALPSISFVNDTDTGIYRVGNNNIAIVTNGIAQLAISATAITPALAITGNLGSATVPSYSFASDTNTGIYDVGSDDLGITTGGTLRLDISTTAITSTLPLLSANGSNTAPTYSFSGDPDTGFYSSGANAISITTGGTLRFTFDSNAFTSTLTHFNWDGNATSPSYSFASDQDNGMYLVGANTLGFSAGGTLRVQVDSTGVGIANATSYQCKSSGGTATQVAGISALNVTKVSSPTITIADSATADISTTDFEGFLFITCPTYTHGAYFYLRGANGIVELGDTAGIFSITAGTGSSINVYETGGKFQIENKRGITINLRVQFLGV